MINSPAFDYELIESYDGKFGGKTENGTWNGLVKMLMDKVPYFSRITITFRCSFVTNY